MTIRSPRSSRLASTRYALIALALAAAGGSAALLTATTSDTAIRKSFVAALETSRPAVAAAQHAGSEDYWLGALRPNGPSPAAKTVSVGDRIVMTLSGEERTFAVASVAEFSPEVTTVDTTSVASRFVLVTARDVNNAAAKPIRFVMEIEGAPADLATRRIDRAS